MQDDHGERAAQLEANRVAAAPIVEALVDLGFPVEDVADLRRFDYRAAIPLLLEWLPKITNPDVKADVVRALSVKWARPTAAPLLVREFHVASDATGAGLRWAIGNALEVVADESVFEELATIARDRRFGIARQMIAMALGKMKDPRAVDVLLSLLDDDDVVGHAIVGLGRLKAERARPALEALRNHPKTWVRRAAKTAIDKIDRQRTRRSLH